MMSDIRIPQCFCARRISAIEDLSVGNIMLLEIEVPDRRCLTASVDGI